MLNITNLYGFNSTVPQKVEIVNKYFTSSTANASDRTWSSVTVGSEFTDRYIVVLSRQTTSMTIGGVSATKLDVDGYIFGAFVPTGTSITISTVEPAQSARSTIGVYTLSGVTPASRFSTIRVAATTNPSTTLGTFFQSSIMAFSFNSGTNNYTWTGLTEDYDQTIENNARFTYASSYFGESQSLTITATNTSSSDLNVLSVYN